MLDAAVRLMIKSLAHPPDDALAQAVAHIRVTDVVAEASELAVEQLGGDVDDYVPLSIGALYQIWPSQADFQSALLIHLGTIGSTVVPSIEVTRGLVADGLEGPELLRVILRRAWEYSRSDPIFRAMLVAYPCVANDDIREVMADGYRRFFSQVGEVWPATLQAAGRRLRPPFEQEHLARAIAALIEGFTLQWLVDPDAFGDPFDSPEWDLATRSIEALAEAFTEPLPADE